MMENVFSLCDGRIDLFLAAFGDSRDFRESVVVPVEAVLIQVLRVRVHFPSVHVHVQVPSVLPHVHMQVLSILSQVHVSRVQVPLVQTILD